MSDKHTILQQIRQAVRKVHPSAQVVLFGSQAKGEAYKESDWDVLILTDKEVANSAYTRKVLCSIVKIELERGITVSSNIRNRREWAELGVTPFL